MNTIQRVEFHEFILRYALWRALGSKVKYKKVRDARAQSLLALANIVFGQCFVFKSDTLISDHSLASRLFLCSPVLPWYVPPIEFPRSHP